LRHGKKLTIKDIAAAAGVSAATVSLVLNGKGEISSVTRARVLEAVASLNYVPRVAKSGSAAAATLRFLKIAKHGHTVNRDHSVFISDYIDGMSSEASRRSYKLEIASFEGQPISAVAETIAGAPISGVIVLGTELTEEDIVLIQTLGVPTVFIDTFHPIVDANFVDMNNEDAVHKVLARFQEQGFERIGFVTSHVGTTNFRLRREAFFSNVDRLGITIDPADILSVESTYEGSYLDTRRLLSDGLKLARCYFCTNDIIAYGFIRALREHGVSIPGDVSIIGFDNLPQSATMNPSLTTIEVSKRKIGYLAVAILDEIINAGEPQPPVKILVGAELVLRDSHDAGNSSGTATVLRSGSVADQLISSSSARKA
jgi:LacI family transcriptional regulator